MVKQVEDNVVRVGDQFVVGTLRVVYKVTRTARYRGVPGARRYLRRRQQLITCPLKHTGGTMTATPTRAAKLGWSYATLRGARDRLAKLVDVG